MTLLRSMAAELRMAAPVLKRQTSAPRGRVEAVEYPSRLPAYTRPSDERVGLEACERHVGDPGVILPVAASMQSIVRS